MRKATNKEAIILSRPYDTFWEKYPAQKMKFFIKDLKKVKNDRPFQGKQFQTLMFVVCYQFVKVLMLCQGSRLRFCHTFSQ